MANAAIVIFWGSPIPGREQKALQFFKEATQFWADKKDKGEVESIDAVEFDHFSADLRGLMIIRGDRDKLTKLARSDEVVSMGYRSELLSTNYMTATGVVGELMQGRMASYAKQVAELLK
jgi:hypothetical protein